MNYIDITMRSVHDWSNPEKAREFLEILVAEDDIFVPEKYDNREPERFVFDAKDLTKPIEIWTAHTAFLLLKRRKPFYSCLMIEWVYREHGRFNRITGSVDERYFKTMDHITQFLSFVRHIYLWGPMVHGYICHTNDWNAKNYFGVPTRVASGKMVSTGGLDLQEGLPGIYWANFFGPLYVNFFGREKFLTAPAYHKEELPDGGLLLLTAPSPLDYGRPEVRALEEAIMNHLGRDAFFEKAYPEKVCRVPQFTFEQASLGRPIEVVAYDPVLKVIPDPLRFIQEAPSLAEALVRRYKGKLDYSPESLKQVDDFILRKSYRHPHPWERETDRQLVRELTAYFGEVLCRQLQGEWTVLQGSGGDPHPAVVFTVGGVKQDAWPFARVIKLWVERVRADGLAIHYMLLQSGEWSRLEQHLKYLNKR
ncbi:MAG: hypothetical protein N2508_11825 [Anaerolineae bacterium]|nr:hypothetical protein [Anaerolineae bacterium]